MKTLRFSIRGLLLAMALVAFYVVAVLNASSGWASIAFTGMLTMLLVAILGIVYRRDKLRAFWVGFAILGWSNFVLAYGPWLRDNVPRTAAGALAQHLHAKVATPVTMPGATYLGGGGPVTFSYPELRDVRLCLQSLEALLCALLGGMMASYFYSTDETNP